MVTPAWEIPVSIRRFAAATHEAGHTLVAIVLGRKVKGAILRQPQGLSGETQMEDEPAVWLDPNLIADREIIENAVVVLLAGQVAEGIFWAGQAARYEPEVDSHRIDDQEIADLISCYDFSENKRADYLSHCKTRASSVIAQVEAERAISRIAVELANNFAISRERIDQILIEEGVIPVGIAL
jgi:hypothetical protein